MRIHEKYMRLAINLAKKGEGLTSPNPAVGAVLVKDGRIVGKGYHKRAGLPHAEVNALNVSGGRSRSATLYVTLEPCDHYGRTPPCTDAIIESGVKKVVIAMKDPNPINNGRGIRKLNRCGIATSVGILKSEAEAINAPYIKFIRKGLPYVTVKVAESLDGKIATRTGDSRWITSEDARRYVHELRGGVDAVMVGVNTVIRDDPLLISKTVGARQPIRIIADSRLRTPLKARVFSNAHISPLLIATTSRSSRKGAYERKGAQVLIVKSQKGGRINLKELMKALARRGIVRILVEGGGSLTAGLIEGKLVDKMLFFIAPKIIGGRNAVTSVEGSGIKKMREALSLKNLKIRRFAKDILIEGDI